MAGKVRVWDRPVRLMHWSLVACVTISFVTHEAAGAVHVWTGYGALAIVALRLVWGFVGTAHARFSDFVRGPAPTLAYARAVLAGRETRFLGHNPLGGWMILALLATIAACSGTGWLFLTDRFFGEEWLEELHGGLGYLVPLLVVLHVAGVAFTSWRQRENLVAAMVTGEKAGQRPGEPHAPLGPASR